MSRLTSVMRQLSLGSLLTFANSLRNPVFARLYLAQTVSLLGDALTWVGLALLAFELAGKDSALVLSAMLTLRVTAFVLLSPLAGALADRLDRKVILVTTHLFRMLIVGLLPLVTAIWQVYVLVFALNAFNAFFTPTYQATLPLVVGEKDYPQALALSSATYELLGVLGPGIAGGVAVLIGAREIFFLDALSFLVAAILLFTLPGLPQIKSDEVDEQPGRTWRDIKEGTNRLFADAPMRYALAMELVASIAGAQVLVNTVGYLKGGLHLGDVQYGWTMAAFGVGATLSALAVGAINRHLTHTSFIFIGALVGTLALIPASAVGLFPLMALWLMAGAGQNWVNLPTQALIAERTPSAFQGRVYGAHFAWSHLWWALAYPVAGWLGSQFGGQSFVYGGLLGLIVLGIVQFTLAPQRPQQLVEHTHEAIKHEHSHNELHDHEHPAGMAASQPHSHVHQHPGFQHIHEHTPGVAHRHGHY